MNLKQTAIQTNMLKSKSKAGSLVCFQSTHTDEGTLNSLVAAAVGDQTAFDESLGGNYLCGSAWAEQEIVGIDLTLRLCENTVPLTVVQR
jgi:hypothetical protein